MLFGDDRSQKVVRGIVFYNQFKRLTKQVVTKIRLEEGRKKYVAAIFDSLPYDLIVLSTLCKVASSNAFDRHLIKCDFYF